MSGIEGAALLDSIKHPAQVGRLDGSYGAGANPWEDVIFETQQDLAVVRGRPLPAHLHHPLDGDCLEGVGGFDAALILGRAPRLAGVHPVGDQFAGLVPSIPGLLEADLGVGAQRKGLALAVDAVVQAPPSCAGGLEAEVHARGIGHLHGLGARLGAADRGVGQGHVRGLLTVAPPAGAAVTATSTASYRRIASDRVIVHRT